MCTLHLALHTECVDVHRYVVVMIYGGYCTWVNLRHLGALVLQTLHLKHWQRMSAGDDSTSPINYNYRSAYYYYYYYYYYYCWCCNYYYCYY